MQRSQNLSFTLQRIGIILIAAIFLVFIYTTIHESGHALAAFLFGGKIHKIDVNFLDFSAHTVYDGTFTPAQHAVISASGWALPVLVFLLFTVLSNKNQNPLVLGLKWISGIMVTSSTIPWVFLPLVYLSGNAPADDVTSFLNHSQLPPAAVALVFALLVCGGIALIIFQKESLNILRTWMNEKASVLTQPALRTPLASMILITVCLAVFLVVINSGEQSFSAPQGYQVIAEVNLARTDTRGEVIYTFEITEPKPLRIYLILSGIKAESLDVKLQGPDGWESILVHGEKYTASEDRINTGWDLLPAGRYDLVVTALKTRGKLSAFLKP